MEAQTKTVEIEQFREHYKAGMKASSFLKIGVSKNIQNVSLKNTYVYYIYIYNKKKRTGVGIL